MSWFLMGLIAFFAVYISPVFASAYWERREVKKSIHKIQ
jgi:hypothetical protein